MAKQDEANFIKHFFNVGLGTAINLLLGFLTTPLITRVADPTEYGKSNIFNTYADIALAILFIGLDRGIIRFFYDNKDFKKQRSILKLCFLTPLISSVIGSVIYIILNYFNIIENKFNKFTILLLCAYVIVNVWNRLSVLMLRLTYNSSKYSLCSVIQKVVYVVIIIAYVFAIKGSYFMMLVLASLISILVSSILSTSYTKEFWKFNDVEIPKNSREIFRYSLPFILFACIDAMLESLDKLAIDNFCTEYDVGIYSSALSLVAILSVFHIIFDTIWLPMQTDHIVNDSTDTGFIQKSNRYITILMFFVAINAIMFKDLLCYILGAEYRGAAQVIPFLIIGSTMYTISDTTISGIELSKKSYLHVVIGLIAILFNFVGNSQLVPIFGIQGAAIATSFSYIIFFLFRVYFSNKYLYVDFKLSRIIIMLILLCGFAYISSYYTINLISVVYYLILIFIYFILYRIDIKDMFSYFKNSLLNRENKRNYLQ